MKFTSKPLVLLFMVAFLSSCVDNLDFDQVDLDIDPIFTSPNVVGISAKIPPIGLAHGVVKLIKGSQTMTIVIKFSFTFVSFSKN